MVATTHPPQPARSPVRTEPSERRSAVAGDGESARIVERTRTVAIGVLALGVSILLCAQVAKPSRPPIPDATSITLAPRAPM